MPVSLSASSATSDDQGLQLADAGAPGTASDMAAKTEPAPPAPPAPLPPVDPVREHQEHTFLNTAPLQSN